MKKLADSEATAFWGALIHEIRGNGVREFVTQPGGNTDDAIRPPSARNVSIPNPGTLSSAAQGNPSRVRDESDTHYSIGCIP